MSMKMTSEERISELEKKLEHILRLVDMDRAPFSYLVLECYLASDQEDKIYQLMDDFTNYVRAGHKINHHDFEDELYKIVPSKNGDYHFAEDVVGALNDEGRYTIVYEALRESGMNV